MAQMQTSRIGNLHIALPIQPPAKCGWRGAASGAPSFHGRGNPSAYEKRSPHAKRAGAYDQRGRWTYHDDRWRCRNDCWCRSDHCGDGCTDHSSRSTGARGRGHRPSTPLGHKGGRALERTIIEIPGAIDLPPITEPAEPHFVMPAAAEPKLALTRAECRDVAAGAARTAEAVAAFAERMNGVGTGRAATRAGSRRV